MPAEQSSAAQTHETVSMLIRLVAVSDYVHRLLTKSTPNEVIQSSSSHCLRPPTIASKLLPFEPSSVETVADPQLLPDAVAQPFALPQNCVLQIIAPHLMLPFGVDAMSPFRFELAP